MKGVVHGVRSCLLVGAALGSAFWPTGQARAGNAEGCVAAYEQAQILRAQNKLRGAREQLLVCVQNVCPKFIATDCTHWLNDVDANTPTIVISARDETGQEVTGVRVKADGEQFLEGLDGKAVPIDPGPHVFQFERGSSRPVERKVVIHQGERNRSIAVDLRSDTEVLALRKPGSPATMPAPPDGHEAARRAKWSAVLGAAGVLSLGSFGYFGLTGNAELEQLRSQCAPGCAQSDVDSARRKLLVADASLGVGVISIGLATWLLLSKGRDSEPRPAALVQFWPTSSDGTARLGVTF